MNVGMTEKDTFAHVHEGSDMTVEIYYDNDPVPEIVTNVVKFKVYFKGNGSGIITMRHHENYISYYRLKGIRKWEIIE